MPLRRLNPKRRPGESMMDWSGPKLEEFTSAPSESVSPESGGTTTKPQFEPVKVYKWTARLDDEMEKRGWSKDPVDKQLGLRSYTNYQKGVRAWVNQPSEEESWTTYYGLGASKEHTESKPIDPERTDLVVDELLKMVDDEAYRKKLRDFWKKLREPAPEPTMPIEAAIKESMMTTFKGEVSTKDLSAQLSAYNLHITPEELQKVLERMLMEGPFDPEFSLMQTGRDTWKWQKPITYEGNDGE